MTIKLRPYNREEDYERVNDFLINSYQPGGKYPNWLQPRWEYMHFHSILNKENLHKIGIWEDDGNIVAIVNYELRSGEAFYSLHADYRHLKREIFEYAEEHLKGESKLYPHKKVLSIYIRDFDKEMEEIAKSKGYKIDDQYPQYNNLSQMVIPNPFPEIKLPEGFKLKSLEDENDFHKINRVLWRGFDHEGEPPEEEVDGRRKAQLAPNFRKDLTIVVEAPDGNYAAFCGMWYQETNNFAFVEPVATDPDYRRMGLGRAAVMESIRRCGKLGAEVVYVETALPFYLSMGFEIIHGYNPWVKYFDTK